MADIVDAATRSRMMSGIRGKDTKPELAVRKMLHAAGFRYRLHDKQLPGKPDLVLPKYRVVIFVHGCFWHGHQKCAFFRIPSTRQEFWTSKIGGNVARDEASVQMLRKAGWRIAIVWECAIKGKNRLLLSDLLRSLSDFIIGNQDIMEIRALP